MAHVVGLLLSLLGATSEAEDQVEGRLLLDVTGGRGVTKVDLALVGGDLLIGKGTAILQLFSSEDQSLLVGRNSEGVVGEQLTVRESDRASPFLVLDFSLDVVNGVRGFDLEGDGFTREARQTIRTGVWRGSWEEKLAFLRRSACLHFLSIQRDERWNRR